VCHTLLFLWVGGPNTLKKIFSVDFCVNAKRGRALSYYIVFLGGDTELGEKEEGKNAVCVCIYLFVVVKG